MGGCLSKKTKEDPNTCLLGSKKKQADVASSRDPPPTESPPRIEEEKVKEVLSETPTCRFVRAAKSNPPAAKVENGLEMEESDLCGSRSSSRRSQVVTSTPSESTSAAASVSLISGNTRAAPDDDDDDDEEEGETVETMKKKKTTMKMRSASSSSSVGMPRSQSPAAGGKREFRGFPSAGASPSPLIRAGEMGNHMRNDHINSSSSYHQSNNNGNDRVVAGESCGRRMRSVSPATSSLKSRTKILLSDQQQPQRRSRHCRSLSSSSCTAAANGRFSPQSQRIPAAARARRQGQDGNFNAGSSTGGDGTALLKEESLENPLVSMECFIFL